MYSTTTLRRFPLLPVPVRFRPLVVADPDIL